MLRPMILMTSVLVVLFGGIFGFPVIKQRLLDSHREAPAATPVTVSVAPALRQRWTPYLSAVGSLAAVNGVDVSPEVAGIVQEIHFESGQSVKKGDVLVQLDEGIDRADLRTYQAQLLLAQGNFDRDAELIKKRVIPRTDFDQAKAALAVAEAHVARTQAIIAEKKIVAPFAGKLGIRRINLGQYLAPGTRIVTLQSLKPLYVNFSLPQQDVFRLREGQPISVLLESDPDEASFAGKINAIDARVDEQTRAVQVQGVLPNDARRLYPGMAVNVRVLLPEEQNLVTVPQTAIAYNPYGDAVFVVDEPSRGKEASAPGQQAGDGGNGQPVFTVTRRFVTLGEQRGDRVAISAGLEAGEKVVTAGQLKLKTGARITIDNRVTLDAGNVRIRD